VVLKRRRSARDDDYSLVVSGATRTHAPAAGLLLVLPKCYPASAPKPLRLLYIARRQQR
jgi:hypothetical protein